MSEMELSRWIAITGVVLFTCVVGGILAEHLYWLRKCPGGYKKWLDTVDPNGYIDLGWTEKHACWRKGDSIERITKLPNADIGVIAFLAFFMLCCVLQAILSGIQR